MNPLEIIRRLPRPLRRHKLVQALVRLRPEWRRQVVALDDGTRVWADLRDANARTYFLRRTFEPEFHAIAQPFTAAGGTGFDVGANFGFCTFGQIARGATVAWHLFEANPDACALLRATAAMHPQAAVTVNHGCVTDRPGESRLQVNPADWGRAHMAADGSATVRNVRLDDYCEPAGIERVAFAKFDIEGWEANAFRGAARLLGRRSLECIYFELSGAALAEAGTRPDDVCALLRELGYRLFFCKPVDLADRAAAVRSLTVRGTTVPVVPCDGRGFDAAVQTDLLALPADSPWLEGIA